MKKNVNKGHLINSGNVIERIPEGYPDYPENEDIYHKFKRARSIDPEDITTYKDKEVNDEFIDYYINDYMLSREINSLRKESDEIEEIDLPEMEEDVNFSFQGDDIKDPVENFEY